MCSSAPRCSCRCGRRCSSCSRLVEAPPSEKAAAEVFEYMGKRAAELEPAAWQRLAAAPLVPIKRAGGGHLPPSQVCTHAHVHECMCACACAHVHVDHAHMRAPLPPEQVFFSGARKKFGPLLEYCEIKHTSAAGAFLAECGVRDTPSVTTLAAAIASNHERFLASMGSVSSYLSLLKELAKGLRAEPPASMATPYRQRLAALRGACCPVGCAARTQRSGRARAALTSSATTRDWSALQAPAAPEDGALKQLYALLGVRSISSAVQVTHSPDTEHASASKLAKHVRQRILERACLLLHDIDQPSCPPRAHLRPLPSGAAARRGRGARGTRHLEHAALLPARQAAERDRGLNACCRARPARAEAREGGEARAGMRIYVVPMSDQRLLLEAVGDALLGELLEASTSSEKLVFGQLLASLLDALAAARVQRRPLPAGDQVRRGAGARAVRAAPAGGRARSLGALPAARGVRLCWRHAERSVLRTSSARRGDSSRAAPSSHPRHGARASPRRGCSAPSAATSHGLGLARRATRQSAMPGKALRQRVCSGRGGCFRAFGPPKLGSAARAVPTGQAAGGGGGGGSGGGGEEWQVGPEAGGASETADRDIALLVTRRARRRGGSRGEGEGRGFSTASTIYGFGTPS